MTSLLPSNALVRGQKSEGGGRTLDVRPRRKIIMKRKCVALISGGMDSALAAKLML